MRGAGRVLVWAAALVVGWALFAAVAAGPGCAVYWVLRRVGMPHVAALAAAMHVPALSFALLVLWLGSDRRGRGGG